MDECYLRQRHESLFAEHPGAELSRGAVAPVSLMCDVSGGMLASEW